MSVIKFALNFVQASGDGYVNNEFIMLIHTYVHTNLSTFSHEKINVWHTLKNDAIISKGVSL